MRRRGGRFGLQHPELIVGKLIQNDDESVMVRCNVYLFGHAHSNIGHAPAAAFFADALAMASVSSCL